jgi:drug/metabolite transporter (DMT)-like permease
MILSFVLAVLAAVSNAVSNVLQRRANSQEPSERSLSPRLVWDLLHRKDWLLGISCVTASFLLQASALGTGELAFVQPVIVLELPLTMIGGMLFLGSELHFEEWRAIALLTAGLAGLVGFLSPHGGAGHVGAGSWAVGGGLSGGLVLALVLLARGRRGAVKGGLFGAAAGITFGLTAALMKSMTEQLGKGFFHIFVSWQTYAMALGGFLGMFLVQNALQAGKLVAAQPGISLLDPFVSIAWGVLAFHERTNGGVYLWLGALSALAMSVGAVLLSRSPVLQRSSGDGGGATEDERAPRAGAVR